MIENAKTDSKYFEELQDILIDKLIEVIKICTNESTDVNCVATLTTIFELCHLVMLKLSQEPKLLFL